jgi:hypothetical protein
MENFKKAHIVGRAFLAADIEFYHICGLPRGVGLVLTDEVKEKGKFIPPMELRHQITVSRQALEPDSRQKEEG